ncbi:MAG: OadG family protein [Candidatus Cloacimonetes bacterium]|nr:OadG family protein [Candidatus Cloacimonadota bacterium]
MKRYVIIISLLLLASLAFSEEASNQGVFIKGKFSGIKQTIEVKETDNLLKLCSEVNIPIKKVKSILHNELEAYNSLNGKDWKNFNREWDVLTLKELGITAERFKEVYEKFTHDRYIFGSSITWVGLSVVFFSLFLINAIIGLFKHINYEKPPKSNKSVATPLGTITGPAEEMSSNTIVAVIIALHKYRSEIEERKKLMLTFKRAQISLWGAPHKSDMPNNNFIQPARGKR